MTRLTVAAERVRQHDAERAELAAAIVEALQNGWRPSEVDAVVPYDRNHVRRIAKTAGVPARPATGKRGRRVTACGPGPQATPDVPGAGPVPRPTPGP